MKKFLMPLLSVALFIGILSIIILSMADKEHAKVIATGNADAKAITMAPKEYQCSTCKMEIEHLHFAAQAVNSSGKTWFFDEIGCLVTWLEDQSFKQHATLWTQTLDTHQWINAKEAWYSRDSATPMGYGFGAHEHFKEGFIDYETMRLKMLRGENMTDPYIRKQLLGV
jgi:hypothetical protein